MSNRYAFDLKGAVELVCATGCGRLPIAHVIVGISFDENGKAQGEVSTLALCKECKVSVKRPENAKAGLAAVDPVGTFNAGVQVGEALARFLSAMMPKKEKKK